MPVTKAELQEMYLACCPKCRMGVELHAHPMDGSYYHEHKKYGPDGRSFVLEHQICFASGLRNSRFAREAE